MELRKNCYPVNGTNVFQIFDSSVLGKGKIMQISIAHFKPHQSCPIHQHFDLHEVFIIESGEIDITIDNNTIHLCKNDVCLVRPGHDHSLLNDTDTLCEILILGIACPLKESNNL